VKAFKGIFVWLVLFFSLGCCGGGGWGALGGGVVFELFDRIFSRPIVVEEKFAHLEINTFSNIIFTNSLKNCN